MMFWWFSGILCAVPCIGGSTFIACMLTIVGYSINATIVIFDRIRGEYAGGKKNEELAEVVKPQYHTDA